MPYVNGSAQRCCACDAETIARRRSCGSRVTLAQNPWALHPTCDARDPIGRRVGHERRTVGELHPTCNARDPIGGHPDYRMPNHARSHVDAHVCARPCGVRDRCVSPSPGAAPRPSMGARFTRWGLVACARCSARHTQRAPGCDSDSILNRKQSVVRRSLALRAAHWIATAQRMHPCASARHARRTPRLIDGMGAPEQWIDERGRIALTGQTVGILQANLPRDKLPHAPARRMRRRRSVRRAHGKSAHISQKGGILPRQGCQPACSARAAYPPRAHQHAAHLAGAPSAGRRPRRRVRGARPRSARCPRMAAAERVHLMR